MIGPEFSFLLMVYSYPSARVHINYDLWFSNPCLS